MLTKLFRCLQLFLYSCELGFQIRKSLDETSKQVKIGQSNPRIEMETNGLSKPIDRQIDKQTDQGQTNTAVDTRKKVSQKVNT